MHSSTLLRAGLLAVSFLSVSAAPVEVVNENAANGLVERGALESRAVLTVNNFNAGPVKVSATSTVKVATSAEGIDKGTGRADAIITIFNAVMSIIDKITGQDIARRQKFTQQMAADTAAKFPGSSVVVVNVGYQMNPAPLSKTSVSYKAKLGSNVSYDVLTWTKGTFTLKGDGGYENWAFVVQGNCQVQKPNLICA